jgi:hypothetical protein
MMYDLTHYKSDNCNEHKEPQDRCEKEREKNYKRDVPGSHV